jgi:hypothetical protein
VTAKATQLKPHLARQDIGQAIKCNFWVCAAGDAGKRGKFFSIFNLKYSLHAVKFRWPTQNYCGPSILRHSPVTPYKLDVVPQRTIGPTSRATELENDNFLCDLQKLDNMKWCTVCARNVVFIQCQCEDHVKENDSPLILFWGNPIPDTITL